MEFNATGRGIIRVDRDATIVIRVPYEGHIVIKEYDENGDQLHRGELHDGEEFNIPLDYRHYLVFINYYNIPTTFVIIYDNHIDLKIFE